MTVIRIVQGDDAYRVVVDETVMCRTWSETYAAIIADALRVYYSER